MRILTLITVLALSSTQVYACEKAPLKGNESLNLADQALFTGKVRVLKVNKKPKLDKKQEQFYYKDGRYPVELTLESVETYTGAPFKKIKAYTFASDSCSKGIQSVGHVYEEALFSNDFASPDNNMGPFVQEKPTLFIEETWQELRKQGDQSSGCKGQGGEWKSAPADFANNNWVNKFNCVKAGQQESQKD